MIRRFTLPLAVLICALPGRAGAQPGVFTGLSADLLQDAPPVVDFKRGFGAQIGLHYDFSGKSGGYRFSFSYSETSNLLTISKWKGYEQYTADFRIVELGTDLRFRFGDETVRWSLQGGPGVATVFGDELDWGLRPTRFVTTLSGGPGVEVPVAHASSLFIELRFHYLLTPVIRRDNPRPDSHMFSAVLRTGLTF